MLVQEAEACRQSDEAWLNLVQAQRDMENVERESNAQLQEIENQKTRAETTLNDQVAELEQRSAVPGPAVYKSVRKDYKLTLKFLEKTFPSYSSYWLLVGGTPMVS